MSEKSPVRPIIMGSTGMVGKAVLLECLEDSRVDQVLIINRTPLGMEHPKLKEIIHKDFLNFSSLAEQVKDYNACFYCLGVPSAGVKEEDYGRITVDFTDALARVLAEACSDLTFCFISGGGTDSTEKGRVMWARQKGRAENCLKPYNFKKLYLMRPGYIQPLKGVVSKVKLYRVMYFFAKPLYFLLKHFPSVVCSSVELGQAMINAASDQPADGIYESRDIVKLGRTSLNGR